MTITKSELINSIATQLPVVSVKDVDQAIKGILEMMSQALAKGDRIEIRGFGSFSLRHRQPRQARNPKTGSTVLLNAKGVPYFKPGKELRDRVNHSRAQEIASLGVAKEPGSGTV